MVKTLSYKNGGGKIIGLGITHRNVDLLKEGKAIHVFVSEMDQNSKDEILIFYRENEDDIKKEFKGLIGINTHVIDKRNEPKENN